ncbi:MAG: hypothetical protein WC334_06360 [Kiritimatiellales bacterium]
MSELEKRKVEHVKIVAFTNPGELMVVALIVKIESWYSDIQG